MKQLRSRSGLGLLRVILPGLLLPGVIPARSGLAAASRSLADFKASQSSFFSDIASAVEGPTVGKLAAGFQVGGNFGSYATDPNAFVTTKAGLIAGGQLEIPVIGRYSVQPEVRFVQKGFNYSQTVANIQTIATGTANYLEVPVLAKVRFPELQPVVPFLYLGPDLGVNLGTIASQTINGADQGVTGLAFKTIDLSVEIGAGASYPVHPGMSIFLQAEYSLGLVNVSDVAGVNWKSQDIQAIAGMMFDLL